MDRYKTIEKKSIGEFKDKGSKFLAYAYPLLKQTDLKVCLDEVRSEHPKATHHCFAYRMGSDGQNFRTNDDGEPSGSAGRPILGQIDSHELINTLIIVVRYYGGTKLGVSGLINAYKEASKAALSEAVVVERDVTVQYELSCDYQNMNAMLAHVKRQGIDITAKNFDELCTINIVLKLSDAITAIKEIENNYKFDCTIRKLL